MHEELCAKVSLIKMGMLFTTVQSRRFHNEELHVTYLDDRSKAKSFPTFKVRRIRVMVIMIGLKSYPRYITNSAEIQTEK